MSQAERIWLANPLAVFTGNSLDASGGLVIADNKIAELVAAGEQPQLPFDQQIDLHDQVLLPGLVNAHHHCFQTLTRAMPGALNKGLFDWLTALYPVWAHIDLDMLRTALRLAFSELLLSGCTTTADQHYLFSPQLKEATDLQAEIATEMGMRVTLCRGSMNLRRELGTLPDSLLRETDQQVIDDSLRVIRQYHHDQPAGMIQIALAPTSPFSISTELMRELARLAKENNVRLHTHLSETIHEEAHSLQRFGLGCVDYLEACGWLGPTTWLAHGIHFNPSDIRRLGSAGVGISHCPSSNMMLSSGICRVLEIETAGSPVGIGVDGSASNDCSNMIQELRQAMGMQRLRYGAANVTHMDALRWGTQGSARLLGRDDIGEIAVGKAADLATFKLDSPRFSGAQDPLAALLLCGAHRAESVMVNGQWRVRKAQLVDTDIDALIAEHKSAAWRLAARAT